MTEKSERRLASSVNVDGTWYRPGDTVPPEVAAQITNPKAWTNAPAPLGAPKANPGFGEDGPRLATSVDVDGKWYRPGDNVPPDIAARITNPKAWVDGIHPAAPRPARSPEPSGPANNPASTGTAPTDEASDGADKAPNQAMEEQRRKAPTKRA
jgi:hypothetical protein